MEADSGLGDGKGAGQAKLVLEHSSQPDIIMPALLNKEGSELDIIIADEVWRAPWKHSIVNHIVSVESRRDFHFHGIFDFPHLEHFQTRMSFPGPPGARSDPRFTWVCLSAMPWPHLWWHFMTQ